MSGAEFKPDSALVSGFKGDWYAGSEVESVLGYAVFLEFSGSVV